MFQTPEQFYAQFHQQKIGNRLKCDARHKFNCGKYFTECRIIDFSDSVKTSQLTPSKTYGDINQVKCRQKHLYSAK